MSDNIRVFETGATRSPAAGKPEYAGYLHPSVIKAFGAYMLKHQTDSAGGQREARNWQKGIPLESYIQSMFRHFVEVWTEYENNRTSSFDQETQEALIESLCALMFNVQGFTLEVIKLKEGINAEYRHVSEHKSDKESYAEWLHRRIQLLQDQETSVGHHHNCSCAHNVPSGDVFG